MSSHARPRLPIVMSRLAGGGRVVRHETAIRDALAHRYAVESEGKDSEARPEVEDGAMDQLFCLLVDRCEVGGAVEQFVQGVALVDVPRFERTVDGGADQSDHGLFEYVLTEVGVLE